MQNPGTQSPGTRRLLAVLTLSAALALSQHVHASAAPLLALGLCTALLLATSITLLQAAHGEAIQAEDGAGHVIAVNGLLSQPSASQTPGASGQVILTVMRDVAVAASATLWAAAFVLEDMTFKRLRYGSTVAQITPIESSVLAQQVQMAALGLVMTLVHMASNANLVIAVRLLLSQ